MPKLKTAQQLVETFKETVIERPIWTFEELITAVNLRTNYKDPFILVVTLKSLCFGGTFGYNSVKTDKPQGITAKAGTPSGSSVSLSPTTSSEPTVPKRLLEEAMAKFQREVLVCKEAVEAAKKEAAAAAGKERIIKVVIEKPGKKAKEFTETYHRTFEDILTLATLRENIFLYGPMGSGKTFIGEQLARHLDLPFSFVSCSTGLADSVLTGMLYPFGEMGKFEYAESEFLKRYETGGVYLLDEVDRADPNLLIVINAALAGAQLAIPKRREKPYAKKHPDFICVGAANTLGTGADRMYTSANKLDASTMDRFAVGKIYVGYDESLEKTLCPDDELRARLTKYRKAIDANRLERAVSSRFMEKAYRMKQAGWSLDRIDQAFFLGWREDEINKVKRF